MELKDSTVISAQVLLTSASGKKLDAGTLITTANVAEYAPMDQTIAQASEVFAKLGFQTGELVGVSLSITAPVSTFQKVFGHSFVQTQKGGIKLLGKGGSPSDEIPPAAWPKSLSGLVAAITFVPPPDFGPTEYFGP